MDLQIPMWHFQTLCYGGGKPVLEGYTDAGMTGDLDNKKSTLDYVFTLLEGAISWQSKLQKCVALSTTDAEYIAAVESSKEMLWLRGSFKSWVWSKNVIEEKIMKLKKVHTNKNDADMLTKVVPGSKLDVCVKLVGMSFKR